MPSHILVDTPNGVALKADTHITLLSQIASIELQQDDKLLLPRWVAHIWSLRIVLNSGAIVVYRYHDGFESFDEVQRDFIKVTGYLMKGTMSGSKVDPTLSPICPFCKFTNSIPEPCRLVVCERCKTGFMVIKPE